MQITIKDRLKLDPDEKLFSKKQAAEVFGVHYRTVERWINAGYLTTTRIGGRVFISSKEIRGLMETFMFQTPGGKYFTLQEGR